MTEMKWEYDDGGRAAAGFKGKTGDCVTRAVAIATGLPYRDVYDALADGMGSRRLTRRERAAGRSAVRSARSGVIRSVYQPYLESLGWVWVPTMSIGSGTTVHLRAEELPAGIVICRVSKHVVTVIDGVIHDIFDPSKDGTCAVYGYYSEA